MTTERECAGCGRKGSTAQCGMDATPVWLGYNCGCLDDLCAEMTGAEWTPAKAADWARARREGRAA